MNSSKVEFSYFASQVNDIRSNAVEASVSILGLRSPAIRQHIINELQLSAVKNTDDTASTTEGILGNPVFEVLFPWQAQDKKIEQFAGTLLHSKTIAAVGSDIEVPYKHQARAWSILNDKEQTNSLVVTSGTGSGKTECFMVPILDDLVRLQEDEGGSLTGVRALFLYPLNALINSQKDRLDKWTKPFGKNLSFCLYNGNTKETGKQENPNHIVSRMKLRETPPPILVTNATMLEYMLIRQKDAPIIEQSKGKLRWIVLDEAHSYVGSTAAELSLLLRRVMLAFEVEAKNVHFVATSATIGDDADAKTKLTNYLSKLAGVDVSQIHIVNAQRNVPALNKNQLGNNFSLEQIEQTDPKCAASLERYELLENHWFARKLRDCFVIKDEQGNTTTQHNDLLSLGSKLSEHLEILGKQGEFDNSNNQSVEDYILRWLDVCSYSRPKDDGVAFLPLRGHLFQRTLSGLYSCVNPKCHGKQETGLASTDKNGKPIWEFGYLFTNKHQKCSYCHYPVYELAFCDECQTPHLLTQQHNSIVMNKRVNTLVQYKIEATDEFSLQKDIDDEREEEDSSDETEDESETMLAESSLKVIMPYKASQAEFGDELDAYPEQVEAAFLKANANLVRRPSEDAIPIAIKETNYNYSEALQHCYFCSTKSKDRRVIRSVNLGAPFFMSVAIPILLDHCPKDDSKSDSLPNQGRQLITFSDSRQGTAKISMKIRQDSERRSLRHLVYAILTKQYSQPDIDVDEIINEISELKLERADKEKEEGKYKLKDLKRIDDDIKEQQALLNQDDRPVISWEVMKQEITKVSEFDRLRNSISRVARVNSITSPLEIAELLLLNEFARRPKNANTLETIGLVSLVYPKLQNIKHPELWADLGLTQKDWTDFLGLTLDFYVREGKFVNLTFSQLNSLSDKFLGRKKLLAFDTKANLDIKDAKYIKNWVQVNAKEPNNSNRMIRLLCTVTDLDPNTTKGKDIANQVMQLVWDDLTKTNILEKDVSNNTLNSYHLNFKELSLTLPKQVWICPVTHRFLDTTFKELTPYIPPRKKIALLIDNIADYQCQKVEIPVFKAQANAIPEKIQAQQWIADSDTIQDLRKQNLWTDISSSVVAGMNTIVTEEHSAQLNQNALQGYERDFKAKKINILNCSTTMEMGVDIGGITGVAMNNVPPHPANYLQRTGRAGRRNESRAIAFTLCKNNPHEQMVFTNSAWPFMTKISPPYITLNSNRIIQRHINAYLLSLFLNHKSSSDQSVITLKVGWFFFGWLDGKKETVQSEVDKLVDQLLTETSEDKTSLEVWFQDTPFYKMKKWLGALCLNQAQASEKIKLEHDIKSITEQSGLYYVPINTVLLSCMESIERLEKQFIDKVSVRIAECKTTRSAKKQQENPYLTKLIMDITGIANGNLISDLARYGFLPRYGFPSGLVEFDPYHSSSFKKGTDDDREDNQSLRNGKPVRDISIAIREYAPGNEVAVDGLVYKSAGIELSQYLTASNKNSAQIIRSFLRCKTCGAMNAAYESKKVKCHECGDDIKEAGKLRFVEPMGFRVDYTDKPHSKIDSQTYVPIEQPKIQANNEIVSLFSPALGDYRVDDDGVIFYHSRGVHGNGYFICLHCGRAESVKFKKCSVYFDNQRKDFQNKHIPLKPVAEFDFKNYPDDPLKKSEYLKSAKGVCNRNGFQTQHLYIGSIDSTNVFELYLKDPQTDHYFSDDADTSLLATLAVILRNALAKCHGINPDELGAGTKPIKLDGDNITAIYIYDKASGGAGFSSAAPRFIHTMFEQAQLMLQCPAACDSACQSCLLTYDTRFIVDSLDRHIAIEYLESISNYLSLSEDQKLFSGAHFCNLGIEQTVAESLNTNYDQIHLYLQGDVKDWSLSTALSNRIKNWDFHGKKINIALSKNNIELLDKLNRIYLSHFGRLDNVTISTWDDENKQCPNHNHLLQLSHTKTDKVLTLGTTDLLAYVPNDGFWEVSNDQIVVESSELTLLDTLEYDSSLLELENDNNAKLIVIDEQLNGSIADFGSRFWELMRTSSDLDNKLESKLDITSITYSDKFLCTPLATMLLGQVLYEFKLIYGVDYLDCSINILTKYTYQNPKDNQKTVLDKWLTKDMQTKVQNEFYKYLGLEVTCTIKRPKELEHHRSITIIWSDSSITKINLDHGFGFMYYKQNDEYSKEQCEFDVEASYKDQADLMLKIEGDKAIKIRSLSGKTSLITTYSENH